MIATPAPYWLNGRRPDSHLPGAVVSIAITAALFAAALVSMTSRSSWIAHSAPETPTMVPLIPPAPVPAPVPAPAAAPSHRAAPPATAPKNIAPVTATPTTQPMAQIEVPTGAAAAAAAPPAVQHRDTANAPGAGAPAPAAAAVVPSAATVRVGAPVAPAGVTGVTRASKTPDMHDVIFGKSTQSIPDFLRAHVPTGSVLAELKQSQQQADRVARRVSTAGNSQDVHVVSGEGKDGAGVPGGGLSNGLGSGRLPFSLFEPGPSAAQRKKDELIDADVRARLARLNARIVATRDSIRADSLRRDSLARVRIIP